MSEWSLPSAELLRDLETSAYSFAYYADLAGRELTRAARFGRRLSIGVFLLRDQDISPAELSALMIENAPDLSVTARVDSDEFHLLMPEITGIGAQAARRRVQEQLAVRMGTPWLLQRTLSRMLVGVAGFPHEGRELSSLVHLARLRAEQSAFSPLIELKDIASSTVDGVLRCLEEATETPSSNALPIAVRPFGIELPMAQAGILCVSALSEALRAGAAQLVIAYQPEPSLFTTLRSVFGGLPRTGVAMRVLDLRKAENCADIEGFCVLAEHGAYSLLGRRVQHRGTQPLFRGVHTSDPLVADCLSHWMAQTAGVPLNA